jgi:hypothetical protein
MRPHVIRGRAEYALTHGMWYYVSENNRAITNLDLRALRRLESTALESSEDVHKGYEM